MLLKTSIKELKPIKFNSIILITINLKINLTQLGILLFKLLSIKNIPLLVKILVDKLLLELFGSISIELISFKPRPVFLKQIKISGATKKENIAKFRFLILCCILSSV